MHGASRNNADIALLAAGSPRRTLPASPVPLPIGDKGYDSLFDRGPGCVGVGLQPAPSRRQVRKIQAPRRVGAVAGSHAAPVFELTEAPCPGVARRGTFRVAGLGVRAPASGRKDGLDVPLRPPGAEGVAVMGPVRDLAGQGRGGPGFPQGPGLGAVGARAARHAQMQGTAPSMRQDMDLGTGLGCGPERAPPLALGRAPAALTCARPTGLSRRTVDRSGAACRWIRRGGPRPSSPSRTRAAPRAPPCPPAQCCHAKKAPRVLACS